MSAWMSDLQRVAKNEVEAANQTPIRERRAIGINHAVVYHKSFTCYLASY